MCNSPVFRSKTNRSEKQPNDNKVDTTPHDQEATDNAEVAEDAIAGSLRQFGRTTNHENSNTRLGEVQQVNGNIGHISGEFFHDGKTTPESTSSVASIVPNVWERFGSHRHTISDLESPEESRYTSPRDLALSPGMTSLRKFEYEKLSQPTEIRVLELLPGSKEDPIRCTLSHCHIDSSHTYEAISYAWGHAKTMINISPGGMTLEIPVNLLEAFRALRYSSKPRSLWADSICINQADDDEKSQHVRLIADIFGHAEKVVVWLGHKDAHYAKRVFECSKKVFNRGFSDVPRAAELWTGFCRLFGLPWFERIWCFQEIVLAQSAVMVWGAEAIPWEQIGYTAAWIRSTGYELLQDFSLQGVYKASLMFSMSLSGPLREKQSLISLMMTTRQFKASDDRDRIYGLLAVPTTDSSLDGGKFDIDPDYTTTRDQLYEDFVKKAVERYKDLAVLSAVQHGSLIEETNSWVPQWDRQYSRSILPFGVTTKTFCASSQIKTKPPTFLDATMIVYGMNYDAVTGVSGIFPRRAELTRELWRIQDLWDTLVTPLYLDTAVADVALAFAKTISAGKDWYGEVIIREEDSSHLADFEAFLSQRLTGEARSAGHQALCHAAHSALLKKEPPGIKGDTKRFMEAMFPALCNRRFFTTRRGRIGIGPACMRSGDAVCILSGAGVPFIIRESGEEHLLAGEAYVHGIMHGEACEQFDCSSSGLTEFRLR